MAGAGHPLLGGASDRLGHTVLRLVEHNGEHLSNPILKLNFSGSEEQDLEREQVTL